MSRIYYASQWVSINGTVVTAVQSVGISTTYNIEPVFQLGQSTVYQDQETLADVEVTIQRLFDGGTPMYLLHLGSGGDGVGLTNSLVETTKSSIVVSNGNSSGAVSMTDMYVSNISYNATVDGNATEDITFIGNKKAAGTATSRPAGLTTGYGVASRQNVTGTGIASGAQSVTISVDLAREDLYTLGAIEPSVRLLTFPIEVTTEVEVRNTSHAGGLASVPSDRCSPLSNTSGGDGTLVICNSGGSGSTTYTTTISVSGNTLLSVNYSGGDAGGGNASATFSYRNYNSFSVSHSSS